MLNFILFGFGELLFKFIFKIIGRVLFVMLLVDSLMVIMGILIDMRFFFWEVFILFVIFMIIG